MLIDGKSMTVLSAEAEGRDLQPAMCCLTPEALPTKLWKAQYIGGGTESGPVCARALAILPVQHLL